ncbi:MAG TPA: transglutaminase family protein, partial [Acidimicrobiales bacterium]|nr:transglutaminase family protein [Acidimicrobiales bacterium]
MTWKVAVHHRTAYVYGGEVRSSYNEARVTPLTTDRQLVLEASVQVDPPAPTFRYWDYWGTMVDAFDIHVPHTELAVTGESVVETSPGPPAGDATWEELRRPDTWDRLTEFLAPTGYVPLVGEAAEAAREAADGGSPADACDAAVEWVRGRLRYEKGATNVSTTADEALRIGGGVCQDFAHLTLAFLRAQGIPARYTSGYVFAS